MIRQINFRSPTTFRSFARRNALKGGLVGTGLVISSFGDIGRASAAPMTMRLGSDSPIGAPHTKSALVMKELVEKGTSGRVQVKVFPDARLSRNTTMNNSIKAGTLDAVVSSELSALVGQRRSCVTMSQSKKGV